jgi:hypothetical protein
MSMIRTLRKLFLGETWVLPLGVLAAVGACAVVRALAGAHGWWQTAGGFVLLALVLATLLVSARRP